MALGTIGNLVGRIFPERQIYHRSHGQVHFISISAPTQLLFVVLALLFMAWVAYATVNVVFKEQLISERDRSYRTMVQQYEQRLSSLRGDVDNLHGALAVARKRFDEELQDLRSRQRHVDELIEQQSSFYEHHEKLRKKVAALGKDIRSDKKQRSAIIVDVLNREPALRQSRKARLREAPVIDGVIDVFNKVAQARSDISQPLLRDAGQIAELMKNSAAMRREQMAIIHLVEEDTQRKLEELEAIIVRTRLNSDTLVRRFARSEEAGQEDNGRGGPLISMSSAGMASMVGHNSPFDRQMLRIQNKMDRLSALGRALETMPILIPLEVYRITSHFGARQDPYTRRPAFHPGLDFGGPYGTPVLATAQGVVSFAGRRGAYGNLVEIDHGQGLKTRYGHMSRIMVRRGERIKVGEIVGKLGSTGRSTGPHLHYEVWFDKKMRDPLNFIEAGRYVHKS